MTVTIGARGWRSAGSSSSKRTSLVASPACSSSSAAPVPAALVSATSNPSSPATSDAVSRSTSWLIVAKIPLFMSSRMMSAGLTPNSSASSLTVIVPGSSIAPRSRGSSVWTPVPLNAPSRRGGLRGPRRPRVPLLLLATGSSFDIFGVHQAPGERFARLRRERGLERPAEGALTQCFVEAVAGATDVRTAPGGTTGLVGDHVAAGCSDDAHELALRTDGPARDTGSIRDAPWRGAPRGPGYDATSPEETGAAFAAAF